MAEQPYESNQDLAVLSKKGNALVLTESKMAAATSLTNPSRTKTEWRRYQDDAAAFFTSIGLTSEVDARVEGARGVHKIDVLVSGKMHGLSIRWVIECKDWSVSIPKEKVIALQGIVQDIGADRGILLSEVGFQSGAIRSSRNTNVTLTSLADLRLNSEESITEELIIGLHWRWSQIMKRLSEVHQQQKKEFGYVTPVIKVKSRLFFLDSALEDGLKGAFPTIYAMNDDNERLSASNLEELIEGAVKLIEQAEHYANENLKYSNPKAY